MSRGSDPKHPSRRPRSSRGGGLTLQAMRRAVSWHRRKLAVVAALAAALTGINAARPPAPPTVEVVRAVARLEGGAVVEPGDVRLARVPADLAPQGALTDLSTALGRTLRAPTAAGQLLSELSVVTASHSIRAGQVVAPLRLADAEVVALLTVGDAVDVLAADSESGRATVVARQVRIVGRPPPPTEEGLGAGAGTSAGALVLVEVTPQAATALAQAAVSATLSVVLR